MNTLQFAIKTTRAAIADAQAAKPKKHDVAMATFETVLESHAELLEALRAIRDYTRGGRAMDGNEIHDCHQIATAALNKAGA